MGRGLIIYGNNRDDKEGLNLDFRRRRMWFKCFRYRFHLLLSLGSGATKNCVKMEKDKRKSQNRTQIHRQSSGNLRYFWRVYCKILIYFWRRLWRRKWTLAEGPENEQLFHIFCLVSLCVAKKIKKEEQKVKSPNWNHQREITFCLLGDGFVSVSFW